MRVKSNSTSRFSARRVLRQLVLRLRQLSTVFLIRLLYYSKLNSVVRVLSRIYYIQPVASSRTPRIRRHLRGKFGILCYHRVGMEGVPIYSRLHPEAFENQMWYLRKHYRLVSLGQLCQEIREERVVPPTLAVTFDDGYKDLYKFAFPVLQRYSVPATIYLIGRCIEAGEVPWYDRIFLMLKTIQDISLEMDLDVPRSFSLRSEKERMDAAWEIICFLRSIPDARRRSWCAEMQRRFAMNEADLAGRMLDLTQVREMHRCGIDFGAHTMSHPVVSRLDPADFSEELSVSKQLLENSLDAPIQDFAYPFGKPADIHDAAQAFLERSGYRSAVTTMEGFNSWGANPFELRRMQIGDDRSLANFSFRICQMFLTGPSDSSSGRMSGLDQSAVFHDATEMSERVLG